MLGTAIGRLRAIGLIEGISFLLLLFVAMPMKYLMDIPGPVTVVGMIHGVLFGLFFVALVWAAIKHRWSILWVIAAFIAASVPFGTFVMDARLKKYQEKIGEK